jgi:alanyl-tRNA synthetase
MEGFDSEMARQRARSRNVTAFREISDAYRNLTATGVMTRFAGHETTEGESRVLLLVRDGEAVESVSHGQDVELVSESTPFYGEAGGQVGDVGTITSDQFELAVGDTVKDPTGLIIHKGKVVRGEIRTGDRISLRVDEQKRADTERNHTATHILHAVLREVLGDHVKQAGSLVAPDRLRFDFSHFSQIEPAQLEEIEAAVNRRIRENTPMQSREMGAEEALRSGATALFEEKYGDVVRVVSLSDFSRELCGGTHVARTGDIGVFKILSESSVASGVRRIEAVTGKSAIEGIQQDSRMLRETARLLKESPDRLKERVEKLLVQQKRLEKELAGWKTKLAAQSLTSSEAEIQQVNGVQLVAKKVQADSPAALREAADRFKDRIGSGIVVLGSAAGEKVFLIAGVTADLTKQYPAGSIIKKLAPMVGGGGGGRPDLAQAGGTRVDQLDSALASVPDLIRGM